MSKKEAGIIGGEKSKIITAARLAERIIVYNLAPTFCAECNDPIPYKKRNGKFCSQSCSAIHNNKKRKILSSGNNCKFCSAEIGSKSTYCNRKCHRDHDHQTRVKAWLNENALIGKGTLKRYLKGTFGDKCSKCGVSEWNDAALVFELEHKDGNSENNRPDNVCLLCPNCHSQTSTFKGKNKGNGRHSRRVRYKKGKSY